MKYIVELNPDITKQEIEDEVGGCWNSIQGEVMAEEDDTVFIPYKEKCYIIDGLYYPRSLFIRVW